MSPIKFRNGGAIKECQAMEVSQGICDFVVMAIDLAYPVHLPNLHKSCLSSAWISATPTPARRVKS